MATERKGWFGLRVLSINEHFARKEHESEAQLARGLDIGVPGDERMAWLDSIRIDFGDVGKYHRVTADTVMIRVATGGENGHVVELIVHKDGSVKLYRG